jgi:hypothetical protein
MVGGVLAEHHPRVEARLVREEIGESLRERGVGEAVESPLSDKTQTIVMAAPAMSMGSETGEP